MKFAYSRLALTPELPDDGNSDDDNAEDDKENGGYKSDLRIEECSVLLNWRHADF